MKSIKNITFGLSYGAYPPKVAATIKCPLSQAEQIFNAYHNEMYPQITEYRENYVLPTAKQYGNLHLGLGCYIASSNPDKDIRTLANASIQFWSILTLLAVNKIHQLIDEANLQNNIEAVLSVFKFIYDNIMYAELNTKSDYCQECGYDGEINIVKNNDGKLIWKCPNCGNTDESKLNICRRTCGLIISPL